MQIFFGFFFVNRRHRTYWMATTTPSCRRRHTFRPTYEYMLKDFLRNGTNVVWHGRLYTLPFLYVGTWRRIMFPEYGVNIPFTIQNYAYVDRFGRETMTWARTFQTRKTRRFDATMIYKSAA